MPTLTSSSIHCLPFVSVIAFFALSGMASSTALARGDRFSVSLPAEIGRFDVVQDIPVVVVSGHVNAGNALDVGESIQTNITHYGSKRPLCYSKDKSDTSVVLGNVGASGSRWDLNKVGSQGENTFVKAQATDGKLKGWYLGVNSEVEHVGNIRFRKLILVQEPEKAVKLLKYPVSG